MVLKTLFKNAYALLNATRYLDFLGPLALRLYLAPIFLTFGFKKAAGFDSVVAWFGNPEWGLGLPFPELMAVLAIGAEIIGGFALLLGLAVRWMAIPLMVTMFVAAVAVHWQDGWYAVAPTDPTAHIATVTQYVNFPGAEESLAETLETKARVDAAKHLLQTHGNHDWLSEKGNFVVLNNGIEFAVTYFVMLLMLFFTGAGRFVSLDYWIKPKLVD